MEITRENLLSLLRAGMERDGHSIVGLEREAGVPKDTVRDFLRGKTQILRADKLQKLLRVIEPGTKVPVQGRIGEEGKIVFYETPQDSVDCPPGLDPSDVSALRVDGDGMLPLFHDGWIIYYTRRPGGSIPLIEGGWQVPYDKPGKKRAAKKGEPADPLSALFDKPCVVKLKDGRTILRTLKRGTSHGLYHLASYNARDIRDVKVEWAARIVFIRT